MVNLVVGWGIEDQSEGPEVSDQLRMDPELEEKNKLWVNQKLRGRNEESSREIEPVSQLKHAWSLSGQLYLIFVSVVNL